MSKEYIKGQISAKQEEINRIKEDTLNQISSAKTENEEEYNSNIEETQLKFEEEERLRDEAIQKAEEWKQKKKEKIKSAKTLSKKLSQLKKGKETFYNAKVKEINTNQKNQIKEVQAEIDALNKQLTTLENEQA